MLRNFWKKSDPKKDPLSFGNLALALGAITESELQEALRIQERRLPIGEVLVQTGAMTPEDRDQVVLAQIRRRGEGEEKCAMYMVELQRRLTGKLRAAIDEFDSVIATMETKETE